MHPLFNKAHTMDNLRYISHRGFTPLAPENSLPSFTYAGRLHQWAIETDIHLTRDGILVCNHNDTIDTTYNGTGTIRDMTLQELRAFRINKGNRLACFNDEALRMPLFNEYLSICRKYGSIPFIEMKTEDAEAVLYALQKEGFGIDEVVMSSSSLTALQAMHRLAPKMFVHLIFAKEEHIDELSSYENAGLSLNETDLTQAYLPSMVTALRQRGLKVCLRAADSVASVEKMMALRLDYLPTNCMHAEIWRKT